LAKQLPPKEAAKRKAKKARTTLPTREKLVEWISANPKATSKREISRAFNVKGNDKIGLKAMLRDLADEGIIEKRGKRIAEAGSLPSVTVLDISGRDGDGGLIATPVNWNTDDQGTPPVVEISSRSIGKGKAAGIGDRVLARLERLGESRRYRGRVMKVLPKTDREILGVVRFTEDGARLEPANRKQGEYTISADQLNEAANGDLVTVEPLRSRKYGPREARVTGVIGSYRSEKAASLIAIHALGIPNRFPHEVLQAAENVEPVTLAKREDWRDLPLITIDPATAKDHDDAVHAQVDPEHNGGHIVTVAIADVAAYVRPGSAMDREALMRGNSVYFPDRVVPMLPERISNDLCSLREGEDRPALAVRMWFGADGSKTRHSFHRVMMRSHAKLAYEQAQAAIDGAQHGDTAEELLEPVLKPLWAAYGCMLEGRQRRQPLELDLPERRLILNEEGEVSGVEAPERLDAHKLIEECMIQANVCAAETLERKRQALIYRVHDAPSLDKLEALREFLRSMDMSLAKAGTLRASHFNGILGNVKGSEREELISQVVLRSQSQAEYNPENIGHFGLQLGRYAHFTSPIRRYADLTVHRALISALGLGPGGADKNETEQLDAIATDISQTERRAMQAERDTVDRLIAGYLADKVGAQFSGRINGVTKVGLFVTLRETGADGFVPISHLDDDYYHYHEEAHALVGETKGLTYQIGQKVKVKLVEALPVAGALRFEILSEGLPSEGLARSKRTNSRAKALQSRGRQNKRTSQRRRRH